jgi:hypothetical protein
MAQLYTPFMTQAGKTIRGAMAQRDQNQAYTSAYMGDPGAMQQLMQLNPQMAQQLVQQKQHAEQQKLVNQANKTKKLKGIAEDRREFFEETKEMGAKIETYPEFQTFLEQRREMLRQEIGDDVDLLPPATPEMFEQVKQVYGESSGKKGAEQKMFASLTEDLTGEDLDKARRIALGLDSAAPKIFQSSAKTFNIGGVPHILDAEGKVHKITVDGQEINTTVVANSKAEIAQKVKFETLTGASRAKAIDKGFDTIVKIDKSIRNIDRATKALDAGAGVGAVEKLWPSIKAASVELDNIQGLMALDVVGATTFGALSKGELDLSKAVALPTGLDTDELKIWLLDRKVAQEKLRAYYNEQIQFLDKGGTVAGFLRMKEGGQDLSKLSDDELFN